MTPERAEKQRSANRRWLAKPGNKEKAVSAGRRWRIANPERNAAMSRAYRERNPDYMRQYRLRTVAFTMLRNARYRAKKFGLPFDLKVDDIVIPDRCPILGIPLTIAEGSGRGCQGSPSLDRLRPELGYVRGNINVISQRANRIKTDATAEEIMAVGAWLRERLGHG